MAVGFDEEVAGLEVVDVGKFREGAEKRAAKVTHEREIIHVLEDADVEEAVLHVGFVEERERAAVKTAIADENKGAFDRGVALAADAEAGRFFGGDLGGGEEVAERAEHLLDLAAV